MSVWVILENLMVIEKPKGEKEEMLQKKYQTDQVALKQETD